MAITLITTWDNPWDPFDEWEQWYNWDITHGYNTCGRIASLSVINDGLGESWEDWDLEQAKNRLVALFDGGVYRKVAPGQIKREREDQRAQKPSA